MDRPTAWAHLPNAEHIDWVLASLRTHFDDWWVAKSFAWDAAWDAAFDVAARAERVGTLRTAQHTVVKIGATHELRARQQEAAYGAIAALVTYDDCAYLFGLPEHAVIWLAGEGDPAAELLFPAWVVKSQEKLNLTTTPHTATI